MRTFVVILLGIPALVGAAASGRPVLSKGRIDLATGLYVHVSEDLVLPGSPRLALQRTYLSGYRSSREFGIGTTHSGEDYLVGGVNFDWVSLMLARGTRIQFKRETPGTSLVNARFLHDATAGEWHRAELTASATSWTLKKRDGTQLVFASCEPGAMCSILQTTDPQGRAVNYRRDDDGRLLKIQAGNRWIALDYDDAGRVTRAHDSQKRSLRYEYDRRGRLERVIGKDSVQRYGYNGEDELESIEEPGMVIMNTFRNGRCVRQSTRLPLRPPTVLEVSYEMDGHAVRRTRATESNGTWREYSWDDRKIAMSETVGGPGVVPVLVAYERDALSRAIVALTVSCKDRQGRPVRESTTVKRGEEDLLKAALVRKYCF